MPWVLPHAPAWASAWAQRGALAVEHGVQSIARHSGVPAVLVAAVGLVVAMRVARRAVHLALEIALALALVLAATRAGWLRF
jgi:hypothetical protein